MKIGRNELCPCGSGKKYKNFCINKETEKNEDDRLATNELNFKEENLFKALNTFHGLMLYHKTHIKEYKKIRKLHGDIVDIMMEYFETGKFKLESNTILLDTEKENNLIQFLNNFFNRNTQEGMQGIANFIMYKNSFHIKSITQKFIESKRYRNPDKVEFLESMLNSEAGLLEVIRVDIGEGYVYLKDVLSKKEYCITDIAMSASQNHEKFYLYTRIITYKGIRFGTGLNLLFNKEDDFIKKWIQKYTNNYNPREETMRFIELYKEYQRDSKGMNVILNSEF